MPATGPWDEAHVKALLRFPRFPVRLIQQEPWQTWLSERGGLKATYAYLGSYPLSPNHHRMVEVVLSNPEAVANVYASRLNVSRATYFYQLRELVPVLVQALNLWQLPAEGAEPAAVTSARPRAEAPAPLRLPTPLTSMIGADALLATLAGILLNPQVRLLTLLGPGGVGKTRFSLELARRTTAHFAEGACFVDLTTIRDAALVAGAVAQALGVKPSEAEQLPALLREQRLLLILDNFEHLMPAALLIPEWLAAAPGLKILVTSRAALHVYGEHEFTIAPLATPDPRAAADPPQLAQNPAVALFLERAQAIHPTFGLTNDNAAAVAALCGQMEGLPLAIELLAAQIKYFSPQALLVRIANSKRLSFLGHALKKLPPRQQTLRGMLDWSYMLLPSDQQVLFCRLGVFAGGGLSEAVAEICAGDVVGTAEAPAIPDPVEVGLTALVDQNMVMQHGDPDGEPRFAMLGITREYALERLTQRGETPAVQRAHALYYLALLERWATLPAPSARRAKDQLLRREYANYHAALQWALEQGEGDLGLRLVARLWDFWKRAGYLPEGRPLTQAVLDQTAGQNRALRALVHQMAGWLAHDLRDYTTMQRSFQASLEITAALGSLGGQGRSLLGLGALAQLRGQWEAAHTYLDQCRGLFTAANDHKQLAWTTGYLGRAALSQGDLARAQALFESCRAAFGTLASDHGLVFTLAHLGQVYLYQGRPELAAPLFEDCLALGVALEETRSPLSGLALNGLGEVALMQGQAARAHERLSAGLAMSVAEGHSAGTELCSFTLGLLSMQSLQLEQAAAHLRESLQLQLLLQEPGRSVQLLETTARLLVSLGDRLGAARLFGAAERQRASLRLAPLLLYQARHAASQDQLRTQLEPATLAEAWSAGESLALTQALTYAARCLE